MKTIRKMSALILSLAMLASGCSGKEQNESGNPAESFSAEKLIEESTMPEELPEGVDWYDYYETENFSEDIDQDKYDDFYGLKSDGNNLYAVINNESGSDLQLVKFDKDMKMIGSCKFPGMLRLDFYGDYVCCINRDEGCIVPFDTETMTADMSDPVEPYKACGDYYSDMTIIGDEVFFIQDSSITIYDLKAKSITKKIDLSAQMKEADIASIREICPMGDGIILGGMTDFNAGPFDGNMKYMYYEIQSGKSIAFDSCEWLTTGCNKISYVNGKILASNDTGIYEIDFENEKCTLRLSFNCTNCNRYVMTRSQIVDESEDGFVFFFESTGIPDNVPLKLLIRFTRSDEYEQANKKVISVASFAPLDYTLSQAIYLFNTTNSEFFAVYDDRYVVNSAQYGKSDLSVDDKDMLKSKAYSDSINKLSIDLIEGKGPDILLSDVNDTALCNDACFVDMNKYLDDGSLNKADFMDNVFEGLECNGGLYQMPLTFYCEGIVTKDSDKTGMTFDEYDSFVKGPENGIDPLCSADDYSRYVIATSMFANQYDLFIKDGKVDVNNDAFRAILDYCKSLPKTITAEDDEFGGDPYAPLPKTNYGKIRTFTDYEYRKCDSTPSILMGLPSADSRAATIGSESTVSISALSNNPDGAFEFIKTLLSEDVQDNLYSLESMPVRKDALENNIRAEIKNAYDNSIEWEGKPDPNYADDHLLYEFEDLISSCTTSSHIDNNIKTIIIEEIPAYIEGQKSFEDVAGNINNRVQLLLDERN